MWNEARFPCLFFQKPRHMDRQYNQDTQNIAIIFKDKQAPILLWPAGHGEHSQVSVGDLTHFSKNTCLPSNSQIISYIV